MWVLPGEGCGPSRAAASASASVSRITRWLALIVRGQQYPPPNALMNECRMSAGFVPAETEKDRGTVCRR